MKKDIAIISFTLTVLTSLFVSCGRNDTEHSSVKKERIAEVGILRIENADCVGNRSYVGTTKAAKSAKIAAKYSGVAEKIFVTQGSHVNKGAVVAQISSQTLKSTRATAAATYEYAKDALERVSKVKDAGAVTEQKLIEIKTEHDKAFAALQGADQALEECMLKAPFAGVIGEVLVENGENVTAVQPIVTIFDISSLEIEISVPEAEMSSIKKGDVMEVRIPALGEKKTLAKVSSLGIVASAVSHSYTCTLVPSEKIEGLLPGMVCSVRKKDDKSPFIVIPATTVKTDTEGRYIWIVRNGLAEKRHITISGYSGDGVIVDRGLAQGDSVIVSGINKISTGTKVKPVSE